MPAETKRDTGWKTTLKSSEFRAERERSWRRLESLVTKIESRGIRALSEKELTALPVLHRAAVSALSVARSISLDLNLLEYLEALTVRSHFCVYGVRRNFLHALRDFFAHRFPIAVWQARYHVLLSAALMLIGGAAAFALVIDDPDRYYGFVSSQMSQGRDPAATTEDLREFLYDERPASSALTLFATFLFQHNTQVGILCFALGFAAAIPVFYLLIMNGTMLGAMSALYHTRDLGVDWWGWVLPHGITELLAIILCGAAGLLQGQAVVFPGRRTRMASLAAAGRHAGIIVIGCVLLFFIAALIEGLFRQLVHSVPIRYCVIATTAAFWLLYFWRPGRRL